MKRIIQSTLSTSFELFKIMVPVVVIIHILKGLGWIKYFAVLLEPLMHALGLPGELGIVWATALINNIYGGIIVLATLGVDNMTTAQATVLGMLMLVAHNLPIEVTVAKRCGLNPITQVILRIFSAFTFAFILKSIYQLFDIFNEPALMLFTVQTEALSVLEIFINEVKNLLMIFCIIFCLMVVMELFNRFGVMKLLNKVLRPFMKPLNISEQATPLAVVGLTLGLAYGAGLIINSVKNKQVDPQAAFLSVTLMGLCHAVIEDTFLIMTIGGELIGLLVFRLCMGFLFMYIIAKIELQLPARFKKIFYLQDKRQIN